MTGHGGYPLSHVRTVAPEHVCPTCGPIEDRGSLLGVQVRGVYDGVLIWRHLPCGAAWPRFAEGDRRHDAAVRLIAEGVSGESLSAVGEYLGRRAGDK